MMQIALPDHLPLTPGVAAPGRRPRLLIVDDQPANIQALHRVFAADCQVLMATDGPRALQLCRDRQPDLVLLDVQMPGMDGHELCAVLKSDPLLRAIAVIFVTSQDHPDDETRALDAGAADFITKPFDDGAHIFRARPPTMDDESCTDTRPARLGPELMNRHAIGARLQAVMSRLAHECCRACDSLLLVGRQRPGAGRSAEQFESRPAGQDWRDALADPKCAADDLQLK